MPLQTFNKSPYHDDYDPSKNFLKVLFKGGYPVQSRELNTLQSIQHEQLKSFANHIFKNGSRVSNARSSLQSRDYARLMPYVTGSTTELVNIENFQEGMKIKGQVSGIEGRLVKGVNAESDDPPTIYFVYTSTAIDGETATFVLGENVDFYDEYGNVVYTVTIRCPTCAGSSLTDNIAPLGKGTIFTIDEGIFYFEGLFITVQKQDLIVYKYVVNSTVDPCKIGLDFVQEIVTFEQDETLLDQSLGFPNSTSIGADRFKCSLKLAKYPNTNEDGNDFILLCKIGENMAIEFVKSDAEYADIGDMIAKRTYETNGDYTITPTKLSFYEHLKENGDPLGWSSRGSKDNLVCLATPFKAYVKGYAVETTADTPIIFSKARDTFKLAQFITTFEQRTSLKIRPKSDVIYPNALDLSGEFTNQELLVYDGVLDINNTPTGVLIGSLKVNDIRYLSGNPQDYTAVYEYFIHEGIILNNTKKLTDAKSFINSNSGFVGEIVTEVDTPYDVANANKTALIFPISRKNIKSLRDKDNSQNGSMSISVRKKISGVLNVNGSRTFTSTTNEFFESFTNDFVGWTVSGGDVTPLQLSASDFSIDATSLTVNLGSDYANQTVHLIVNTLLTAQKEKTKTLTSTSVQTNVAPDIALNSVVMLGKADVISLQSVQMIDTALPENPATDLTSHYQLVIDTTSSAYNECYIKRIVAGSTTPATSARLLITFDYFQHSGNAKFFTVDSYVNVDYEDIPTFTDSKNTEYDLRNCIDFRRLYDSNTVAGDVPVMGTFAIFDLEYYVGRADLLQIDKNGNLFIKTGEPSDNPKPPIATDNAMGLYEIYLKPYGYTLKDVQTKFIENKRYTMRMIGRLEDRLKQVEYYTVLNLLEKSVADMSIKDVNGLDKFKNGFVADDFTSFQAGDLLSKEFKCAVDRYESHLRPSFKTSQRKLEINKDLSSGAHYIGNVAIMPYNSVLADSNPYATKDISINPYLQFTKKGNLVLSPNTDTWSDDTILPKVVTDIDAGVADFTLLATASGVLGTDWGSWIDQNTTIVATDVMNTAVQTVDNVKITATASKTTSETSQVRTGTNTTIGSKTQSYTIDDVVKDVQIIPYMRETVIEFYATGLKPSTRLYMFFDETPVTEFCRDIGFQLSVSNASEKLANVEYGAPMFSDTLGNFKGEFKCPANTFFTGQKTFYISNDPSMQGLPDVETTFAKSVFFAGGLSVTKQSSTLNLTTPTMSVENLTDSQVVKKETYNLDIERTAAKPNEIIAPPANTTWEDWMDATYPLCKGLFRLPEPRTEASRCLCTNYPPVDCDNPNDPVAQSFVLNADSMVTGIDIFLKQVDISSDVIWVELRTMYNGYPTTTVLARKEFKSAYLIANGLYSSDSTVPLHVEFDFPVYVEKDLQYCFAVGGASPNTRIWVAKLGESIVNIPNKILENSPTFQSSFRSLNGGTWNAEQLETLKYNLYIAQFQIGTMSLRFQNQATPSKVRLPENPLEFEDGSDKMRVYCSNHAFTEGDTVSLSLFEGQRLLINSGSNLPPQVRQAVTSLTGSATITKVERTVDLEQFYITLENTTGFFEVGQTLTFPAKSIAQRDAQVLASIGGEALTITLNATTATLLSSPYHNLYPTGLIAGIALSELNKDLTVFKTDSIDSFIVQLPIPATATGLYGANSVHVLDIAEKYEMFNVTGAYQAYTANTQFTLTSIAHGKQGSLFEAENYAVMDAKLFDIATDTYLEKPCKIASKVNEEAFLTSPVKSVTASFIFANSDIRVSPVVNLDTFALTTVSNRVEWIEQADLEAEPNGTGRFVNELNPINGSESYKYVTKTIKLKDPAYDLHIFVDAYNPLNTDFEVYVKRITSYDNRAVDDVEWVKVDKSVLNYSADLTEFIEQELLTSDQVVDWDLEEPYTAFKVKLVGKSKNSANPPLFKNFRAIAVT